MIRLVKKSPFGSPYIERIGRIKIKEGKIIINRNRMRFFFKRDVSTPSFFQSLARVFGNLGFESVDFRGCLGV